uniref:Uncharacterized protein n=1 Tax=Romanomermis culicivorax TaxID=13658 RepID=A0A915KV77_ROMCU
MKSVDSTGYQLRIFFAKNTDLAKSSDTNRPKIGQAIKIPAKKKRPKTGWCVPANLDITDKCFVLCRFFVNLTKSKIFLSYFPKVSSEY